MTFKLAPTMVALMVLVAAAPGRAETVTGLFGSGVKALEEGKPEEAARVFRDLHERYGITSPDLLQNLAAAEYESGRPGWAVLYLHRAALTAPGTAAAESAEVALKRVRSALNQAQGRAGGARGFVFGPVTDAWTVLFGWADAGVAWFVFLCLWGLGFLCLSAWRLWRGSRGRVAGTAGLACLAASVLTFGVAWGAGRVAAYRVAVVVADEAPLYESIDAVERSMSLPDGAEVRHIESRGGFVRVRLSSGREGWVPEAFIGIP